MTDREPLLLLHGVTGSSLMWRRVMPLLASHHVVIAPNALGHRGGARATERPVRIRHVVDDAERLLDELGWPKAHLVGNSLGGWVALELARRRRALTVCALSPAGAFGPEDGARASLKLRLTVLLARRARATLPLLSMSAGFRRFALRDVAAHGDRVSRTEFLAFADDAAGCEASADLLATPETLAPLAPDCPVTIAWSEYDRIFPAHITGTRARALVPAARYIVLPGVGHVPMMDDPELVARTVLTVTRAEGNTFEGPLRA